MKISHVLEMEVHKVLPHGEVFLAANVSHMRNVLLYQSNEILLAISAAAGNYFKQEKLVWVIKA